MLTLYDVRFCGVNYLCLCLSSGNMESLTQACSSGNVEAVRVLLKQGDLREGADDGDSLLSLAASAGYYELCQVRFLTRDAAKIVQSWES